MDGMKAVLSVILALVARIHARLASPEFMGGRDKPDHDGWGQTYMSRRWPTPSAVSARGGSPSPGSGIALPVTGVTGGTGYISGGPLTAGTEGRAPDIGVSLAQIA
jgi:hypothetical protein